MGQGIVRKLWISPKKEFWKSESGEKFAFANDCIVQTKHSTNKLLNTKCAKEHGLLAKRIKVEKR